MDVATLFKKAGIDQGSPIRVDSAIVRATTAAPKVSDEQLESSGHGILMCSSTSSFCPTNNMCPSPNTSDHCPSRNMCPNPIYPEMSEYTPIARQALANKAAITAISDEQLEASGRGVLQCYETSNFCQTQSGSECTNGATSDHCPTRNMCTRIIPDMSKPMILVRPITAGKTSAESSLNT